MSSLARFLLEYARPGSARLRASEVTYSRIAGDGQEEELPATLHHPPSRKPLRGWVVLHGLTYTGREHPSLLRFVRALAASGAAVLVPEIPEWRRLRPEPGHAVPTIQAAVLALEGRPEVQAGGVALIGFSFGATQALVAAADPRLHGHLAAVAAWGGYRDVPRLFHFGLTGRHELDGEEHVIEPDPYGRWIMGASYLCRVPGYEGFQEVAAALDDLAREAGARGVFAGDPVYDASKAEHRRGLPTPGAREVFDLFAPPAGRVPSDIGRAEALAQDLARAAVAAEPLMDPGPYLGGVTVPTVLAHGRDDRLVPFTESIRLSRDLPARALRSCTVTRLFEHSGHTDRSLSTLGLAREGARFLGVLRRILRLA